MKLSIQEKLSRQQRDVHFLFLCYKFLVSCGSFPTKLSGSQVSHSCKWWVGWAYREVKTLKKTQGKLMVKRQEMQQSSTLTLLFPWRCFAPYIIRFQKITPFFSFGFLINSFFKKKFFFYLFFVPSSLLLCFLFVLIL